MEEAERGEFTTEGTEETAEITEGERDEEIEEEV